MPKPVPATRWTCRCGKTTNFDPCPYCRRHNHGHEVWNFADAMTPEQEADKIRALTTMASEIQAQTNIGPPTHVNFEKVTLPTHAELAPQRGIAAPGLRPVTNPVQSKRAKRPELSTTRVLVHQERAVWGTCPVCLRPQAAACKTTEEELADWEFAGGSHPFVHAKRLELAPRRTTT